MNINITEDLLTKCAEAGRAAACGVWGTAALNAFARAVIETWEASRTPGQLERTNHALALELADVKSRLYEAMEAKEVAINREAEQMNRAENLKAETIQLKADVAELNDRLHERTQLFLTKWPRGVLPPWPVVKVEDGPEPEIEWHNPQDVESVGEGFRMLVKGETIPYDGEFLSHRNTWETSLKKGQWPFYQLTYRTATHLPNPLPR